jgi:hypothetical protein
MLEAWSPEQGEGVEQDAHTKIHTAKIGWGSITEHLSGNDAYVAECIFRDISDSDR